MTVSNTPQDDVFNLANLMMMQISEELDRGYFYYDVNRKPLFTLDQVMIAMNEDRWPVEANDAGI